MAASTTATSSDPLFRSRRLHIRRPHGHIPCLQMGGRALVRVTEQTALVLRTLDSNDHVSEVQPHQLWGVAALSVQRKAIAGSSCSLSTDTLSFVLRSGRTHSASVLGTGLLMVPSSCRLCVHNSSS